MKSTASGESHSIARGEVASAVSCGASGIVVGWLFGLSLTPVIGAAIPILLTMITAIVAALAGLDRAPAVPPEGESQIEKRTRSSASGTFLRPLSAIPMAMLLIGIVPGSVLGIRARTNQWFGPDVAALAAYWKTVGLNDRNVPQALFDQLYPSALLRAPADDSSQAQGEARKPTALRNSSTPAQPGQASLASGLLTSDIKLTPQECDQFRTAPDNELRALAVKSGNDKLVAVAMRMKDAASLRIVIEELANCPRGRK